ncbi:hypothetical protein AK830_g7677 [Neonectria ditissima]|uniref:DUF2293 domain-containing protein n=1 Tax=Neonectria ditissima TaxID=78410 RepID=A0A0P7BEM4_9HYPO|nr:hypothetical protein AK830_g7677 [Neonectria ditissima]
MAPKEPVVSPATPMPKGYGFLRKGNAYLTANTRRKTHAANEKLYVVVEGKTPLGLRAPTWILNEVRSEEFATRDKRQDQVRRRDGATEKEFETAVRRLFPQIPEEDIQKTIKRALEKRSGRVGRTSLLVLDQKVQYAVVAHVRHSHTQYDTLIRGKMSRNDARIAIKGEVAKVLSRWRGTRAATEPKRNAKGKTSPPTGPVNQTVLPTRPSKPPAENGKEKQDARAENRRRRRKKSKARRLAAKQLALATALPKPLPEKNKHKQRLPRKPRQREGTRRSARLHKSETQDLKILGVFIDDEDGSEGRDARTDDEASGSDGLQGEFSEIDGFLVDSSEEESDSEWNSE